MNLKLHTLMTPHFQKRNAGCSFREPICAATAAVLLAVTLVGCAAPQKTASRGVGRPPPEQAPVVYSGQSRSGSLITPESDPFAVR